MHLSGAIFVCFATLVASQEITEEVSSRELLADEEVMLNPEEDLMINRELLAEE